MRAAPASTIVRQRRAFQGGSGEKNLQLELFYHLPHKLAQMHTRNAQHNLPIVISTAAARLPLVLNVLWPLLLGGAAARLKELKS